MWAVKRSSSTCARRLATTVPLFQSASPQRCRVRLFSSNDEDDEYYWTGKVKFYRKDKGFGFIIPDSDPSAEIWVHRTSLDTPSPPIAADEFPVPPPHLVKNERVRFRVEPDAAGKHAKAVGVQLENGSPIPLYRIDSLGTMLGEEHRRFGAAAYKILQQSELSDELKWEHIKIAASITDANIAEAAEKQKLYGPKPEEETNDETEHPSL